MLKVKVTNIKNGNNFENVVSDQAAADKWLQENAPVFGQGERWLQENELPVGQTKDGLDSRDLIIQPAAPERIEGDTVYPAVEEIKVKEYRLPPEYTVNISDATQESEEKKEVAKSELALDLGFKIVAYIRYLNTKKEWTVQSFQDMMETTASIKNMIYDGAFESAIYGVQNYSGPYWTEEEKASILEKLMDALQRTS